MPSGRRIVVTEAPENAEIPWEALAHPVTPIDLFFRRNHFPMPAPAALDPRSYVLRVEGGTNGVLALDLPRLRDLPPRTVEATIECAGNGRTLFEPCPPGTPWSLGAVSTGVFTGVPLAAVLGRAGIPRSCCEVLFEGTDGDGSRGPYARSLPLDLALGPDVILALTMNGVPLPREHGGPLRLVVPGFYGMASVKWLRRIAFLDRPFEGYFQAKDYVVRVPGEPARPAARIAPRALMAVPIDGERVVSPVVVGGWTWSGDAAVTSVDVLADGTPFPAVLGEIRGPHAWRSFRAEIALAPGVHDIAARARDEGGGEQPDRAPWNEAGYENNSMHRVRIVVTG